MLQENNIDKQRNTLDTETKTHWEALQKIDNGSSVKPIYIAVRDTEPEEDYIMQKRAIPNIEVDMLRRKGIDAVVEQVQLYLSDCDYIYISFDVDSMDPDQVSYGTGTPVKGGLYLEEAKTLIKTLVHTLPEVHFFECTEVNPLLDTKGNVMAKAAYEILTMVEEIL